MALLPQRGDTGFTLAGFLILAALGTFIWKGAPLESVRPSSEKSGWYEREFAQQVPARLWQDPFKAVYAHEQAVKSGAAAVTYIEDPSHKIRNIVADPQIEGGKPELTVLMVLVSPGSYAELEERRRRRRYAVLSGLGEEHFVPRNPEALSVFYRPKLGSSDGECFSSNETDKGNSLSEKCYSVPYEWYDYEGPAGETSEQRQVLVLWLNEPQFVDAPLTRIKDFLVGLLPVPEDGSLGITVRATLLGPARSDALRNLVTKEKDGAYEWLRCSSGLSEFNITSSTATVADADLIGEWTFDPSKEKRLIPPLEALQQRVIKVDCNKIDGPKSPVRTEMQFLRTIRSDEVLIKNLAAELKDNRSISEREDYVVVISEWDTYFGRFLPRAFTKHFCAPNCDNVLRYSYQRGMDGIIAGEQGAPPPSQRAKQAKAVGLAPSIDVTPMRRPVGTGQFDYLRRLATDIRKKDRELRLQTGHGVRAVVLLGSDVYDKLLILRALRPELPGAVFATTDLDAHLLHPTEYSWTRNMIVASTYDLSLSPDIPMTTMPFRDSYQTSVYLATRLVFNSRLMDEVKSNCDEGSPLERQNCTTVQERVYGKIPPQLFEVGRQSLIPLSRDKADENTWNRVSVGSFASSVSLGLFAIALLGIFAFHQLRPMAGRVVAVLVILLLLFSLLGIRILTQEPGGEPINLVAGASVWPAEYIRLLGVVLAFAFIWSVVHRLRRNWCELGARYFWGGSEERADGITIAELSRNIMKRIRHPIRGTKQIKLAQVLPVIMVVGIMLIMIFVLRTPLPLSGKIPLLIGIWTTLIVFWWATIYGHIWKDVQVKSVNKLASCMPKDAIGMWRTYGEYGEGNQRFLRTVAYILIYFAFASILFAILGAPASPCRGELACKIDRAILGFGVLSMLVLLFLVVDAARLCICWVDSMPEQGLDWSKTRKEEFVQRLRLPETHAVAWIQIHLIGERSAEVTRLIYYPVLVILLLLLARSTYFDNWDFPQALAIVIGLNFVIALGSVVRLNFVAQSVRGDILRRLQEEKLAADRAKQESYEPSPTERQELIQQLESLRIGAYLRVWDQPPVRATLLLLGGVALTYAEYITVFLR
ncbi:MAG: hypothetical protein JSW10_05720 [Pseudomonadota bacterium]|nr:MAG: hypothetical protein JSW10_05720 [Pseudomonadota bacterium]